MTNAAKASSLRNTLKRTFRLNPWSKFRVYPFEKMVQKYKTPSEIIRASGRTDNALNRLGGIATVGGAISLSAKNSCGCK